MRAPRLRRRLLIMVTTLFVAMLAGVVAAWSASGKTLPSVDWADGTE